MKTLTYKNIEYSEIFYSELGQGMRFDAEYWEASYLRNEAIVKSKKYSQVKEIASNPQYGISIEMNEAGIGYSILKMDNIMGMLAEDKDAKFANIPEKIFQQFQLKKFDVLFNRVNSDEFVGRTGIYLLDGKHTFASYLVKVDSGIDYTNCYLTAYLNCKYGKMALQRVKRRAVNQANINAKELSDLNIPLPSEILQKEIQTLIVEAQNRKVISKHLYEKAEQILFTGLALENWKPKTISFKHYGVKFEVDNSITNKMFSEVIKNYRFNAEYWEPQYDEIIAAFDKFPRYKLSDLVCYPIASGATPKAGGNDYTDIENGYPFLRAVDLVDGRVNTSDLLYIKSNIHGEMLKRTQIFKNDVLLSIAGTVGRSAIFNHDFEANINQALCILRLPNENIVKRLYLIVFFNSLIGNKYLSKTARQGLQTNLNLKEVGSLEIPILDMKVQNKIASTVLKSFQTSDKSKFNLEIAKRAVEIFIEQNEGEALKYIQENVE